MTRGIGAVTWVQAVIPEWATPGVVILTLLGSTWVLGTVLLVGVWTRPHDREPIAAVAGTWLAGAGIYGSLKTLFALPRPEQLLIDPGTGSLPLGLFYELAISPGGFGFPSGHAANATLVWGGLALWVSTRTRIRRLVGASTVIGLVAGSRVALGVHYVVDVISGIAVGGGILVGMAGLWRISPVDRPTTSFGLAIVTGGVFVVVTTSGAAVAAFTGGVLGSLVWQAYSHSSGRVS